MMALSGVRSSWDMLARNSDLCWLATSSCRLLSSISRKSRAFWIARADWVAKVFSSSMTSGGNSPGRVADHDEAADQAILAEQRHREQRPVYRARTSVSRTRLSVGALAEMSGTWTGSG